MSSNDEQRGSNVVLEVDGESFPCKRDELVKESPYFGAMFGDNFIEKDQEVVRIEGVDAAAMSFILHWMRDRKQIERIKGEEVLVVMQAAAMLQFHQLQQICEQVMVQRWLNPENCLLTAATADQLSLTILHQKAYALALWQFEEVRCTQAFLELPFDALVQYLSNDTINLGSKEEEFKVFEAASWWLEYMPERCSATLKVFFCIRMNFISVSDLKCMLDYACVVSCIDAQLLLKCIICVKEGEEITTFEEKAITKQDSPSGGSEENNGCCDSFKKIADHIKTCGFALAAEAGSVELMNDVEPDEVEAKTSSNEFSTKILLNAKNILSLPKRKLPTVACVIGRVLRNDKNLSSDDNSNAPVPENLTKNRNEKTKSETPYIYFIDHGKSDKPVPIMPLSKINQGPTEAIGYTVVSKGQDLYVVGGEYLLGYGNWNKSVWKYNVWNETWTFETSLAVPRRHHSVVFIEDDLYVIGGFGKFRVIMDSVDRYNFSQRAWHKCSPLPISLYSAATCVINKFIYVISSQVYCYYPAPNTWVTLNDIKIPSGSSFNTAMPYGRHIYLTGFYSPDLMFLDPFEEKCIKCIGRFQHLAAVTCIVGDKIYSFTDYNDSPSMEVFDIKTGTFKLEWADNSKEKKISFKKSGGCFPLVLYDSVMINVKNL